MENNNIENKLKDLRDEYSELAERNWKAIQKFSHKTIILLSILVAMMLALGATSVILANKTSNLSTQNSERIKEIALSRKNSILISCNEQNERHEKAKIGLDNLEKRGLKKSLISGEQVISVEEFVNAIAPSYDCKARLIKLSKP